MRNFGMSRRERMFRHIYESYIDRGLSPRTAARRAAATVNKYRAQLARGRRSCRGRGMRRVCRIKKGPRLVTRGGSRRQWYPGKLKKRERYVCLEHGRSFKKKAALLAHFRSH